MTDRPGKSGPVWIDLSIATRALLLLYVSVIYLQLPCSHKVFKVSRYCDMMCVSSFSNEQIITSSKDLPLMIS